MRRGLYILSPLARADLENIWADSAKLWGIDQAEIYVRRLAGHLQLVADNPSIGRNCSEIRFGYHKYQSGSHFFFYRLVEGGVDVVRILHGRMDVERHL